MKRKWIVILLILFVIISGSGFPIFNFTKNYSQSLTGSLLYVNIVCYIELGIFEKKIMRICNMSHATITNICVILAGMIFRYILEFGEVSNTYNFTASNILLHVSTCFIISMISYTLYKKAE